MSDGSTVRRSDGIAKLAAAMVAVQGEIANPPKNKQNPHLKNWYADLVSVREAVLPVFARHKIAVTQLPCELDGEPAMTTLVMHESGEWIETTAKIRPGKTDPQSVGSAQSYARRYALMAIAGVMGDDDDDGHAASQPAARPAAKPAPQPAPAKDTADSVAVFRSAIRATTTLDELKNVWGSVPEKFRAALTGDKDERKAAFAPAPSSATARA